MRDFCVYFYCIGKNNGLFVLQYRTENGEGKLATTSSSPYALEMQMLALFRLFVFQNSISLCNSPGCPGTHFLDHTGVSVGTKGVHYLCLV